MSSEKKKKIKIAQPFVNTKTVYVIQRTCMTGDPDEYEGMYVRESLHCSGAYTENIFDAKLFEDAEDASQEIARFKLTKEERVLEVEFTVEIKGVVK